MIIARVSNGMWGGYYTFPELPRAGDFIHIKDKPVLEVVRVRWVEEGEAMKPIVLVVARNTREVSNG